MTEIPRIVVPDFPLPLGELAPLRAAAEQKGSRDFTPLWSGQAAALSREMPAAMLMQIGGGRTAGVAGTRLVVGAHGRLGYLVGLWPISS